MPSALDRVLPRTDDVLALGEVAEACEVFCQRSSGHREAVAVKDPSSEKEAEDRRSAADVVQVLHHVLPARLEVSEKWDPVAHVLEIVERQRNVDGARHRDQMQHGVGRAAERHDGHHRVFEGLPRHDVARLDVSLQQLANRLAGPQAFLLFSRVLRGRRRAVG